MSKLRILSLATILPVIILIFYLIPSFQSWQAGSPLEVVPLEDIVSGVFDALWSKRVADLLIQAVLLFTAALGVAVILGEHIRRI
ncbi:MAG: hypothetical protein ACTSR0_02490 [Candidatus Asgardarchaeia archaeon]